MELPRGDRIPGLFQLCNIVELENTILVAAATPVIYLVLVFDVNVITFSRVVL
jgi:hypothetical protein